jgi:hypothetical protein
VAGETLTITGNDELEENMFEETKKKSQWIYSGDDGIDAGEHSGQEHLINKRWWGCLRSWMWTINGPDSLRTFKNHDELPLDVDDGGGIVEVWDDVEIWISKSSTRISIFVQLTRRPRSA